MTLILRLDLGLRKGRDEHLKLHWETHLRQKGAGVFHVRPCDTDFESPVIYRALTSTPPLWVAEVLQVALSCCFALNSGNEMNWICEVTIDEY